MDSFALSTYTGFLPPLRSSSTGAATPRKNMRRWRHSLSCATTKFAQWTQRRRMERERERMWAASGYDPRVMADLWAVTLKNEQ